ncbi:MAG: hypothetical protein PF450_09820 [Bacteroidales bacterium]|jgi:hypothetical protein|nr:hypothetical protein [Bacteroidales bacterium]
MLTKARYSEEEALAVYRVGLTNVESHSGIAENMEKEGFDVNSLTTGKKLLADSQEKYDACMKKKDSLKAVSGKFKTKWKSMDKTFRKLRRKVNLIFSDDPQTAERLAVLGAVPTNYVKWMGKVKKFYTEADSDPEIQNKLATLKISAEDISNGLELIKELELDYANLMKVRGEKQALTKAKAKAFEQLQDWMSKFYTLARISLEEDPQLLEVLGKRVKS